MGGALAARTWRVAPQPVSRKPGTPRALTLESRTDSSPRLSPSRGEAEPLERRPGVDLAPRGQYARTDSNRRLVASKATALSS